MQKKTAGNQHLLLSSEEELMARMMGENHPYKKIKKLIPLGELVAPLKELYKDKGAQGRAIEQGFAALLLQFWEDLSDRQMERALQENVAMRWFCGIGFRETTPDHRYFGRLRDRIGTQRLYDLFKQVNQALEESGLIGGYFTFVDSTGIVSKLALWEERDEAIAQGEQQLNNAVVPKYAKDKQARFGAKGKKKFWFGYKRQVAIDMKQGIITKAFADPANVPDSKALKRLLPQTGMVVGDKGYSSKEGRKRLVARGLHDGIIRKNNDSQKDWGRDGWCSKIRMPYENVFSRARRRARYVGKGKCNSK